MGPCIDRLRSGTDEKSANPRALWGQGEEGGVSTPGCQEDLLRRQDLHWTPKEGGMVLSTEVGSLRSGQHRPKHSRKKHLRNSLRVGRKQGHQWEGLGGEDLEDSTGMSSGGAH